MVRAIFDFLAPGFLGKLTDLQKNYVKPIEDGDTKALEQLRVRVRPFVLRRENRGGIVDALAAMSKDDAIL